MEIVPKEALTKRQGGSYFLSDKQLVEASDATLKDFSALMDELVKAHPHLYFGSTRHIQNNGYVISWWVRDNEHGTEESGDPKVLPWR